MMGAGLGGGGGIRSPSATTRILFNRLEESPFYSGTRDFETIVAMRNAGFRNFRFTGCPALYSLPDIGRPFTPVCLKAIRQVVFSCGNPSAVSEEYSIRQHVSLVEALRDSFPTAELVVAAHQAADAESFRRAYGWKPPVEWSRLWDEIRKLKVRVVDLSGGLSGMERLYSTADLHVGYRVHAHVLMTSWRKPSVLISEDCRGSGMSDVISGPVFSSYELEATRRIWPFSRKASTHRYDMTLPEKVVTSLVRAERTKRPVNCLAYPTSFGEMARWFAQFRRKG